MPVERRQPNRINTPSKKKVVVSPQLLKFVRILLQTLIVVVGLGFVLSTGWNFIYKQIKDSYKPNAQEFSACHGTFLKIKTKPMYGVVFKTNGSAVEEIFLTTPASQTEVKAISLKSTDWVSVYFSNNFQFTQIGEFLRLSKLERGDYDFCYILEQLSLTSGVPIEYVVVDDSEKGLSSSISLGLTQEILGSLERNPAKVFDKTRLPMNILTDGTKVSVTTYESFREQFPTFFKIEDVSQEQAFVEVYNATAIEGYASIFSRKWLMLGIDVSRIGNATHEEVGDAVAILYVKNESQYARTLAMIKSSFPEGRVAVKQGRPTNMVTTGDIVVFLLKR